MSRRNVDSFSTRLTLHYVSLFWLRRFNGAGDFPGGTVRTRGCLVRLLEQFTGPKVTLTALLSARLG